MKISLKCQRYLTFPPPHQQIFIEFSIFADFFLTVWKERKGGREEKEGKGMQGEGSSCKGIEGHARGGKFFQRKGRACKGRKCNLKIPH